MNKDALREVGRFWLYLLLTISVLNAFFILCAKLGIWFLAFTVFVLCVFMSMGIYKDSLWEQQFSNGKRKRSK